VKPLKDPVKINAQVPEKTRETMRTLAKDNKSTVQGVLALAVERGLHEIMTWDIPRLRRALPKNGHLIGKPR
jgi:hypothetical protein